MRVLFFCARPLLSLKIIFTTLFCFFQSPSYLEKMLSYTSLSFPIDINIFLFPGKKKSQDSLSHLFRHTTKAQLLARKKRKLNCSVPSAA